MMSGIIDLLVECFS